MSGRGWLAAGVALAVGGAVAAGLMVMESPSEARARRLDERRVADLRQLARDIDAFWTRRSALPASLDELAGEGGLGDRRTDPERGTAYEYRVRDGKRYELCATFAAERPDEGGSPGALSWAHGVGRQCFVLTAGEQTTPGVVLRNP
jgi:hypothetical protein